MNAGGIERVMQFILKRFPKTIEVAEIGKALKDMPEGSDGAIIESLQKKPGSWIIHGDDIVKAAREAGAYASDDAPHEEVVQWTCQACGYGFRFRSEVSDWEPIKEEIFSFCPRCGFVPRIRYHRDGGVLQAVPRQDIIKIWEDEGRLAEFKTRAKDGGQYQGGHRMMFFDREQEKASIMANNERRAL